MLTLYIENTGTVNGVTDYKYVVMTDAEKIAEGRIKGHKWSDGWRQLVKMIAEESHE
uniref:Uncharacterized protein n=1 Tax=viral metagenome TaxID=1070528 RepID=A0A6M3LRE5_9ZZZZ